MRPMAVLFALSLGACAAPPVVQAEAPKPPPEPTCAERARQAVAAAEEAERLRGVVDDVRRWAYISDWKVVDAGKCRVLVLRRGLLLFPDGSLYDSFNTEQPLAIGASAKALLARVYACRLAQLEALSGQGASGTDTLTECPDPRGDAQ